MLTAAFAAASSVTSKLCIEVPQLFGVSEDADLEDAFRPWQKCLASREGLGTLTYPPIFGAAGRFSRRST
jgi:hypothetical protein